MTNCRYITFDDRKHIETLYLSNIDLRSIAERLGVHLATIYREISRGYTGTIDKNGRNGYSATIAQEAVNASIKRRGHKTKNKTE